jgi:hypothetical protein
MFDVTRLAGAIIAPHGVAADLVLLAIIPAGVGALINIVTIPMAVIVDFGFKALATISTSTRIAPPTSIG